MTVNPGDGVGMSSGVGVGSRGGNGSGGSGTGECDPLSLKLLGARLSHGEGLAIRLDFIGFVVSKSRLELTFDLVEMLWRDFLQNPLSGAWNLPIFCL